MPNEAKECSLSGRTLSVALLMAFVLFTLVPAQVDAQSATQDQQDAGFLNFFRKTEVAGTLDTYFHYNFNEPETGTLTRISPLISFIRAMISPSGSPIRFLASSPSPA